MPLPLSCAIITLNEEDNISRTLEALSFIEDIVVIDSGSTDKTVEIAKSLGARVFFRKFVNYADQKNFAIEQTKYDWVLAIDADEVVSDGLKSEITELFTDNKLQSVGYLVPRLTYYLGKWIRFGGYYPNYQIRLFKKTAGEFSGGLVHERVKLIGKPIKLKNPLFHYSYKNISDHLQFIDRYSSLFAEEEFRKGKRSSVFWAFLKACFKGFYMYWIRLGILDGKQGFVLALLGFYYNFLKYLKLYEKSKSISSFFVMVDAVHDVKSSKSTKKDGNQVHVG
ncbi:glycosyltransferase family 2 protein [Leptospira congkakensis]|uniref:Glycosyltransferase family 2 protein n=1 Tax=Leptospira congkakensis TaxID=2484932 RepID=A0A4Z1A8P5_9LEPT|nr:glycosyltransferase family 2 protein [Leptospira congkakensis]TGL87729.1 glycosyltransferase family 2 protein [Leptospira congkakensis]TGL89655.1 glycosyltransferase family 2 protein [Leptospira congkakensis]TGL95879.1 glycosyltransferase family 2 protein [Leptospira congkakensis]